MTKHHNTDPALDLLRAIINLRGGEVVVIPGRDTILRELTRMGLKRPGDPDTWKVVMPKLVKSGFALTAPSRRTHLTLPVGKLMERIREFGLDRAPLPRMRNRKQKIPKKSLPAM